jgi:hypothetical protein
MLILLKFPADIGWFVWVKLLLKCKYKKEAGKNLYAEILT